MKHDFILTCGDSWTEGHTDILECLPGETWPHLLADMYNVPYVNVAFGGASNTVIAMQPVQEDLSDKLMEAKNPLIIFNFTVHGRWTFFHPIKGRLHSHFSVNPDDYTEESGWIVQGQKEVVTRSLILNDAFIEDSWTRPWPLQGGFDDPGGPVDYHNNISGNNKDPLFPEEDDDGFNPNTGLDRKSKYWLNPWMYATHQAIRMVLNYKKLMPHATIMWGFMHERKEELCFGKDIFSIVDQDQWMQDEEGKKVLYPGLENCYNKYTAWEPLERCVIGRYNLEGDEHGNPMRVSVDDTHPNRKGLRVIADAMYNCVEGIHNEKV